MAQLVAKDWEEVGIKTVVQVRERALHFQMRDSNDIADRNLERGHQRLPVHRQRPSMIRAPAAGPRPSAPLMRQWYATGGKEGVEPTPELKKIVELIDKAKTVGPDEQIKIAQGTLRALGRSDSTKIGIDRPDADGAGRGGGEQQAA